jgi:hypothetical protein
MPHNEFLVKKANGGIRNAKGNKLWGGGKIAQLKLRG